MSLNRCGSGTDTVRPRANYGIRNCIRNYSRSRCGRSDPSDSTECCNYSRLATFLLIGSTCANLRATKGGLPVGNNLARQHSVEGHVVRCGNNQLTDLSLNWIPIEPCRRLARLYLKEDLNSRGEPIGD